MTNDVSTPPVNWEGFASSVRGAAHVRRGTPNQDAGGCRDLPGGGVVLAVADGHGDAAHPRSDRGARFAVNIALELLALWVATARDLSSHPEARAFAPLKEHLLLEWRLRVDADLAADPPARRLPHEAGRDASAGNDQRVLYGTTLLAAALTSTAALYLQIGDGDILAVADDGGVRYALYGHPDTPINQTNSLCQADALERFDIKMEHFVDAPPPALVLLSSDGYANSFGTEAAFLQVGSDLQGYLRARGPTWIASHLEEWLTQTSTDGSGDDITLALAWSERAAKSQVLGHTAASDAQTRERMVPSPSQGEG